MQPKRGLLSLIRRVAGLQQILQRQQQLHQQQRQNQQQLLALGNGLKYFSTDPEAVRATVTYKRCAQLISLLSPMDVEAAKYSRFGRDFDGGYVMLDDFDSHSVAAAYSFGIAGDVSWDEDVANRGIEVFMYDHSINGLPKQHPGFRYFKLGITGVKKGEDLKTLKEILAKNGHVQCTNLIMKMDIEGCEWDVFQHAEAGIIGQFSQIVVEFHGLVEAVYEPKALSMILSVLRKLNETHQSIHVHANSSGMPLWIGGLVMPYIVEVTYLRRDSKYKFIPCTRQFPTELDQPTYRGGYDVYLGRFDVDASLNRSV